MTGSPVGAMKVFFVFYVVCVRLALGIAIPEHATFNPDISRS
ncbi:hypothetical protein ACTXQV_74785, partial [Klebsiella pneumoniae]